MTRRQDSNCRRKLYAYFQKQSIRQFFIYKIFSFLQKSEKVIKNKKTAMPYGMRFLEERMGFDPTVRTLRTQHFQSHKALIIQGLFTLIYIK